MTVGTGSGVVEEAMARVAAAERVRVRRHADVHVLRLRAAARRGVISQDAADVAARQIGMFADDVLTGMHVEGGEAPIVRRMVREIMMGAANG